MKRRNGQMMMKQFNIEAKRELTLEGLSQVFLNEYSELIKQYYRNGKSVVLSEYYIYISEEAKPQILRFSPVEYKKFLQKGLSSVSLTKKKRSVYLGVEFESTEDGKNFSLGARDLVGFSSSY